MKLPSLPGWPSLKAGEFPEVLLDKLRAATDPRLFPPSHRWAPRGMFLRNASVGKADFTLDYSVLSVAFRVRGTLARDGQQTVVTLEPSYPYLNYAPAAASLLAGLVLLFGHASAEARLAGAWFVFTGVIGVVHAIAAGRRARAIVPSLAHFWGATIDP